MRKTIEQLQFEKDVRYRSDTSKYRTALWSFIDNSHSTLERIRQGEELSIELFKNGTYRILRGRVISSNKRQKHRGWIMPLWVVGAGQSIVEELNKELTYARGNSEAY